MAHIAVDEVEDEPKLQVLRAVVSLIVPWQAKAHEEDCHCEKDAVADQEDNLLW